MVAEVRAAAIGHTGRGDWGHRLHMQFGRIPGVRVVAVADPEPLGRHRAAEEAGAATAWEDYREMLVAERPDVVSIAPRVVTERVDMVRAAAEAGAHIYLEKPIARTLAEADEILAACTAHGVRIAVAHQARYNEPFRTAQELVRAGAIGRLLTMHGRGKEDHRGGGEDTMVIGPHVMDLMRLFAGDAEWVSAHVTVEGRDMLRSDFTMPAEDVGPVAGDAITATFGFAGGVHGFYESIANSSRMGDRWGLTLVGTEGVLALRYGDPIRLSISTEPAPPEEIREWSSVDFTPASGSSADWGVDEMNGNGNVLAIVDLLDAARGDRPPLSSGEGAMKALEMIHGIYWSHLTGRRISLPLADRRHPLLA